DGIRDKLVTGVQTCALPISAEQEGDRHHDRERDRSEHDDRKDTLHAEIVADRPALRYSAGPTLTDQSIDIGGRPSAGAGVRQLRSEERRAGKEARSRVSTEQ